MRPGIYFAIPSRWKMSSSGSDDDVSSSAPPPDDTDLCADTCSSLLDLRQYYARTDQQAVPDCPLHPWAIFLQWYRGKLYHTKHAGDPFENPELYNANTPCLSTGKYDVMFFPLGDLLLNQDPYLL